MLSKNSATQANDLRTRLLCSGDDAHGRSALRPRPPWYRLPCESPTIGRDDWCALPLYNCPNIRPTCGYFTVAGTLTNKMAPALRKVYDQMPEPRV
jgi:hypothetical protein